MKRCDCWESLPRDSKRGGVTLVELIVVIAVLGLLAALLLPAVQYARESSRRLECSSRLRQLGLAFHTYHDTHAVLPPVGRDVSPQRRLLPFAGVEFVWNPTASPALLRCPSDGQSPSAINFAINAGIVDPVSGQPAGGICASDYFPLRLSDVTDGTSTTCAFSEWIAGRGDNRPDPLIGVFGVPNADRSEPRSLIFGIVLPPRTAVSYVQAEQLCDATDVATAPVYENSRGMIWARTSLQEHILYLHILAPNRPSCFYPSQVAGNVPSSQHARGVNCVFVDGHVRFVSENIDRQVWRSLGTRNGNEQVAF